MPSTEPGRGRRVAVGVLGVLVSVALLWWAVHDVAFDEVMDRLRTARPLPLALAALVATLTFPIRAIRWRWLLRAEGGSEVAFGPRWHATAIGFTANNVLPLRLGEVARAWVVNRLGRTGFTPAVTSLVVERLFDALALLLSLSLGLLLSGLPAATRVGGRPLAQVATVAGAAGLAAFLTALAVVLRPRAGEWLVTTLLPAGRLREGALGLVRGIVQGLAPLADPRRLALVSLWSLVLWGVNAASFFLAFPAFGIDVGYGGALLLQALVAFGVAVPSTPGYVGPFEAVIVAVLSLYAVGDATAFSYALAYHVTTFVPIVLLGVVSLAATPVALGDLRRAGAAS